MAHFANEATQGYPTGGPRNTVYYPNAPLPASTANPHGVANSPDEYHNPGQAGDSYSFFTREQKIVVTGAAVSTPYAASPTEPYPTGSPPDLRQWVLDQAHTKQEQVEEKDRWRQDTENLRAGGQLANGAPVA